MRLDAHQHFWTYSEREYPWMQPGWPIRRDCLPPDLAPLLAAAGLDGCIAVQARQTPAENEFLFRLADQSPIIKGVVGWVDLRAEDVDRQLADFAAHPRAVGIRHVVQDEADDQFVLQPAFLRGMARLAAHGLAYDVLIYPRQLPAAIQLCQRLPGQRFVLDHLAKPRIAQGELEPWRTRIRQLAACENVCCKLSGMVTEARWQAWTPADFQPYVDVVLEAFGIDRVMYGSDWPVCLLSADYAQVHRLAVDSLPRLSEAERAKFLGGNAAAFYRVKP